MPRSTDELEYDEIPMVRSALPARARLWLLLTAGGLIGVFAIAAWLHPYDKNGQPLRMRTHTQLGLKPCNFEQVTGNPCPSCGMTTSFSLLIHGDVMNSLRANWVGTLAALVGLATIPWASISLIRGKYYRVRPSERMVLYLIGGFAVLTLVRWVMLLMTSYLTG